MFCNDPVESVKDIASKIKVSGKGIPVAVFNTTGWERSECMKIKKPDAGSHDFVYSILPHKGSWRESGTVREGYCLNNELTALPIKSSPDASLPGVLSFVEIDNENVVISAFKPAESDKAVVLRLYEGAGVEARVKVKLGFEVGQIREVDLNENKTCSIIDCDGRGFEFNMGRFEIKTFKIYII